MKIPLDANIKKLSDTPHTISYVIRKRQQLDSLSDLPKDKQPPDDIVWDGTPEDLDSWIDMVLNKNANTNTDILLTDVEG